MEVYFFKVQPMVLNSPERYLLQLWAHKRVHSNNSTLHQNNYYYNIVSKSNLNAFPPVIVFDSVSIVSNQSRAILYIYKEKELERRNTLYSF